MSISEQQDPHIALVPVGERLIALGAKASFESLQGTVRDACEGILVEPVRDWELVRAFPCTSSIVSLQLAAPRENAGSRSAARPGLVSRRSTPSGALRRIVVGATAKFGAIQLQIRPSTHAFGDARAKPLVRATTTLAGFLRSGRVVQEDTLLRVQVEAP